ncbi:MAG: SpoIVB peptidase S55 domain-containing protein [Synergistales bacterium]|nr:SpoIVB peptidase S55 domain-containing protein [Synergistales bacterium]
MSMKTLILLLLAFNLFFAGSACPSDFSVPGGTLPSGSLREGAIGVAYTVVKGNEVVSFPVKVLSVMPSARSPRNLILVRASGPVIENTGGIAAGMSGSPVFIDGKLIGAIGYGWSFSEHQMGLVTPIEDMAEIWNWPDRVPSLNPPELKLEDPSSGDVRLHATVSFDQPGNETEEKEAKELSAPLTGSGYSPRSAKRIEDVIGHPVILLPGGGGDLSLPVEYEPVLRPGEAVSVLVAWGDVSLAATGTLTAISKDGRFLAFAHPFTNRGAVAFPLARAWIHQVVPSLDTPFKIGTPTSIVGIVTQDRPQGIGGFTGRFAPVMDISLNFRDVDSGKETFKRFKTASDPFMMTKVIPEMVTGLVDNVWGRIGEGSAKISLKIEGGKLVDGWRRTNMFFSTTDLAKTMFSEFTDLVNAVSLNPFFEIIPFGVHIDVEATADPRVLLIEDVSLSRKVVPPGGSFDVEITLRPYRKEPVVHKMTLKAPGDAQGVCEVVVRGGGIEEPDQESILMGWRTIRSLDELLKEFSAMETNDEVVAEVRSFGPPREDPSSLEAEEELQRKLRSQRKEEKIREGSFKSYRSNYYVDGLLRRMIRVVPE